MMPSQATIRVQDATDAQALEQVRSLLQGFATEFAAQVTEVFAMQNFDAEVAGLPGRYAEPAGCLLLATVGGEQVGCVGLRDMGAGTCEMKRLYVAPAGRGLGVGRLLVSEVIKRAESKGYRRMILDTLPGMRAAIALYHEFGFVPTVAAWSHPAVEPVFLEKGLGAVESRRSDRTRR